MPRSGNCGASINLFRSRYYAISSSLISLKMTGRPCKFVLGIVCCLKNTRYRLLPTTVRTPCPLGQTLCVSERGPLLPQGESSEAGRNPSTRRDSEAARQISRGANVSGPYHQTPLSPEVTAEAGIGKCWVCDTRPGRLTCRPGVTCSLPYLSALSG